MVQELPEEQRFAEWRFDSPIQISTVIVSYALSAVSTGETGLADPWSVPQDSRRKTDDAHRQRSLAIAFSHAPASPDLILTDYAAGELFDSGLSLPYPAGRTAAAI